MKAKNTKKADLSLKKYKNSSKKPVENSSKKTSKSTILLASLGFLSMAGGIAMLVFGLLPAEKTGMAVKFPEIPSKTTNNSIYSNLTGLPLADASQVTAPAYCIQTPNGMDGARPQAGLNEAGVVFEAIAEAGITRFAAIYQDPTSAIIGPIRSLRLYYLQWDTPFDCTIVHAGGAPDALQAVSHGYKDLTENYAYMYRGTYGSRRWNNLFTTSAYLAKMNTDRGYGGSNIKGFARMTPEESLKSRVDSLVEEKLVIYEASSGKTSTMTGKTLSIGVNFGGIPNFNVRYNYNADNNTYARSYASGYSHDIYACPAEDLGEKNPEDNCTLKQLEPAVVVVMVVPEKRASDNYHEDITTIGTGEAHVFQNGIAIKGSWKKASVEEQIEFFDESGSKIALAPGQTFVETIPEYGSVEY
ncbi:DUF3048 domain-containing protein [Candidatus Saccharibacteria bacterium]|nr:DUF3048 domain-containing protein [Candidatus Saccharibacteria bacterium]